MIFGNLIVAFVTGLISSVGHCLGMCGGIVAIYSARRSALAGANPGFAAHVASLLPVHAGRITTYALLGAVMGTAGAILEQVGGLVGWQGALSIIVGIVIISASMALNLVPIYSQDGLRAISAVGILLIRAALRGPRR